MKFPAGNENCIVGFKVGKEGYTSHTKKKKVLAAVKGTLNPEKVRVEDVVTAVAPVKLSLLLLYKVKFCTSPVTLTLLLKTT